MIVKLLTERHLEFLSLKGGCTGSSESTLVKMSNCWKSRALAHILVNSHTMCKPEDTMSSNPVCAKQNILVSYHNACVKQNILVTNHNYV